MNDENNIIKKIAQQLKDYKEHPDDVLWQNIENKINKTKFSAIKTITIVGSIILLSVIVALIVAPTQKKTNITEKNSVTKTINTSNNQVNKENTKTEEQTTAIIKEDISFVPQSNNSDIENITVTNRETIINRDTIKPINKIVNTTADKQIIVAKTLTPAKPLQKTIIQETKTINNIEPNTSDINSENMVVNKNKLVMPNAFAPLSNIDTIMVFKPAYCEVKNFEMQIFSRNGNKMFATKDINFGWDGKYKGQIADKGTYVYYIKYEDMKGQTHTQQGTVWLHR